MISYHIVARQISLLLKKLQADIRFCSFILKIVTLIDHIIFSHKWEFPLNVFQQSMLKSIYFSTARNTFLNEIAIIDRSIIDQDEIKIIQIFLYGNSTYSVNDNKLILDASIKYNLETKRFDIPIFQVKEPWSMHNCQDGIA